DEEMLDDETVEMTGAAVPLLTVIVTAGEAPELPAASRATAVSVWAAFVAVVVVHEVEYGGVVRSPPILTPSSLNWTPTTPTLSAAVAVTVTVPVTAAAAVGAVMATVGARTSGPLSSWAGTLTRKASRRLPPRLLVQMK